MNLRRTLERSPAQKLVEYFIRAFLAQRITDVVAWAERHVRLPGSARSEQFRRDISPWIIEPMQRATDGLTRTVTFVKPIQCGGSTAGEVVLCYWLSNETGDIFYNWEDDEKAKDRWEKRVERILKACDDIQWPLDRFKSQKCLVAFQRGNLTMQGVHSEENLDSDSVRFLLNEEIHNWEPGRLVKAEGRTTACWNSVTFNISNAGKIGDQLHQAKENGTDQSWTVKCPGCSNPHHEANSVFHRMRTRWDAKHPELGGLRYDADGCRREDGSYDYNRLAPTVRFQMPCGYVAHESPAERRALSLSGRYSEPANSGAHLSNRSYTLEAVAVDYIPWLRLIQEKHRALFARRHGDPEPWRRYITERECGFYDPDDVPVMGKITLSSDAKKNRDGLKDRDLRLFGLDRQQGVLRKGEFDHWWLVIRDFDQQNDSQLVFEGKVETDEEVIRILDEHGCERHHGAADSGDDTTHVYRFCLKYGINAIKGGVAQLYTHPDGSKRIYSLEKPLHPMMNAQSKYDYTRVNGELVPDPREPWFCLYSKIGIHERLAWLMSETKWIVPSDVSDDYQQHMEGIEIETGPHPITREKVTKLRFVKSRYDLRVCEAYIALQLDMAAGVGAGEENLESKPK